MSSRALPYRVPAESMVSTDPWSVFGDTVYELPPFIDGWDYATDLHLFRGVRIDREGFCAGAGLPPATPLSVCVRIRPSTSLIRRVVARLPVPPGASQPLRIEAKLLGAELSGNITIETLLELGQDIHVSDPFIASRGGSILWQEETSTALEGDSGLVPMAPVSFAQAGLPPSAAWYVSLDTGRWDWTALGSLLVLLNTDNPVVATCLGHPDDPSAGVLWSTLGTDLVTDVVGRAVEDVAFMELCDDLSDSPTAADPYSLAALVRALVRTHLVRPTETVDEALRRLRDLHLRDPSLYRASVQDGLRYLRGVGR
jgi:hypothetical protein